MGTRRPSLKNVPRAHRYMVEWERLEAVMVKGSYEGWTMPPCPGSAAYAVRNINRAHDMRWEHNIVEVY